MKLILPLFFIFNAVLVLGQHTNVMISDEFNPNEPSIGMDINNPQNLVAGANINSFYYSHDGGLTWTNGFLSSEYGVWGDPTIACDTAGNFYFFHLSNPPSGNWIDRIVCQKSLDDGETWSSGTYTGLNGVKVQDKQWVAIDRTNNNIYMTWTQFDVYGSSNPADSSNILFSKSVDGGLSWSVAKRINAVSGDCVDSDNTTEGAVPAVGPDGEVYVAWAGPEGLVFDRSMDQGETWLAEDILVTDIPGGWDYNISGIYRSNGLPVTVCDLSDGPNRGTIYINWTDQRNGEDDTDVWLVKSTDGGNTWSQPIRVNDDAPGKQQFLTWMSIDQMTGYLWFVFYDRRNTSGTATDVYMAVSKDGGATFRNFKISDTPFSPISTVFFGDYTNIVAHNNIVRPIWTRLDGAELSLWTTIVNADAALTEVAEKAQDPVFKKTHNYPNPFTDKTYISFKLRKEAVVTINILDLTGKKVTTLVNGEVYPYGKHIIPFDPKAHNLVSGTYFYTLLINGVLSKNKMIFVGKE